MRNNGNQFLNKKRKQVEQEEVEKNTYEDDEIISSSEENADFDDISAEDHEEIEGLEEGENFGMEMTSLINNN